MFSTQAGREQTHDGTQHSKNNTETKFMLKEMKDIFTVIDVYILWQPQINRDINFNFKP